MNAKHRLSIGLPVYNGEQYLRETLDSILSQTYSDFELLISDNASTDNTKAIVLEYAAKDERIRYIYNSKNVGAAENFNQVFRLSSGELFKWASHDDLIAPEYLQSCVDILDRDPGIVLSCTKALKIDEQKTVTGTYDYRMDINSPDPARRFHDMILVNHFCLAVFGIFRRKVLVNTPLIAKYVGSDRNLLAEISLWGRIYEVPEYLFFRRDHPMASTRLYPYYSRLTWFDPQRGSWLSLPHWKISKEYLASVHRSPLSRMQKMRCYWVIGMWYRARWRFLMEDIKAVIVRLFPFAIKFGRRRKKVAAKEYTGGAS